MREAELQGKEFTEDALFRSGSSSGWREELSEETLAFYESIHH